MWFKDARVHTKLVVKFGCVIHVIPALESFIYPSGYMRKGVVGSPSRHFDRGVPRKAQQQQDRNKTGNKEHPLPENLEINDSVSVECSMSAACLCEWQSVWG